MQNEKTRKAMEQFVETMFQLYQDAEALRDCTEDPDEKEIFNKTRSVLHELKFKARALSNKWQRQQ